VLVVLPAVVLVLALVVEERRGVGVLVLVLVLGARRGLSRPALRRDLLLEQGVEAEHDARGLRVVHAAFLEHLGHRGDLDDLIIATQVQARAVILLRPLDRREADDGELRAVRGPLVELGREHVRHLVALDAGQDDQFVLAVPGLVLRLAHDVDEPAVLRALVAVATLDEARVVLGLEPATLGRARRRPLGRLHRPITADDDRVALLLAVGPEVPAVERGEEGLRLGREADGLDLLPHLGDGVPRDAEERLLRKRGLRAAHLHDAELAHPLEQGGLPKLVIGVGVGSLGRPPRLVLGFGHGLLGHVAPARVVQWFGSPLRSPSH